MKKFMLAVMLAITPLVSACGGNKPDIASVPRMTLVDEKALYAAELGYNSAAKTYIKLVREGVLSEEKQRKIQPMLVEAYDVLLALREAYNLGDATTFDQRLVALTGLVNKVEELI